MPRFLLVTLTALYFLYNNSVSAQNFAVGRQEVGVSYGYWTSEQVLISLEQPYHTDMIDYTNSSLDFLKAEKIFGVPWNQPVTLTGRNRSGAIFATYLFKPIEQLGAGIGMGFQTESGNFITTYPGSTSPLKVGTYKRTIVTLAPELRLSYAYNDWFHLYGLLGLGRSFYRETVTRDSDGVTETINGGYWMFQVSPLGIKVGKKIAGFIEGGFGYKGLARGGVAINF